jgi:hypothetical protein
MTATVTELKTGLQTRLATITNLRAYAQQPDQVNPSVGGIAWPTLESVTYHGAMRNGLVTHVFTVSVIVGRAAERTAQNLMDTYLSYDSGIRAAIEADPTLGGYAQTLIVEEATNISTVDANDTTYLTVDFRVVVYA